MFYASATNLYTHIHMYIHMYIAVYISHLCAGEKIATTAKYF